MRTFNCLPLSFRTRNLALVLGGMALVTAPSCSSDDESSDPSALPGAFGGPPASGSNSPENTANGDVNAANSNGDVTNGGVNEDGQATGFDNGAGGSANSGAGNGNVAGGAMTGAAGAGMSDIPPEPVGGYFESGAWQGYAWTTPVGVETTVTPADFGEISPGDPFCVNGSVGAQADYGGVSLMGFSINQAQFGVDGAEPDVLTAVPTGAGIAVNFQKTVASTLRIQIQGPNGETDENDRWCFEIEDVAGPVFAPYTQFNTKCYGEAGNPDNPLGNDYAMEPLEAVVFTVPGSNLLPTEYDYCVSGFADGNSIADAPAGIASVGAPLTGTLAENFRRAKVLDPTGKSYIVQNNAWNGANPEGGQQLSFAGNSFTVTQQNNPPQNTIPVSFPSIFIGHNGSPLASNSLATSADDNLPLPLGQVNSVQTTFNHNGGQVQGEYNATYDIWFANGTPTQDYDDAQAAFLMVWLHKSRQNPIGIQPRFSGVSVAGEQGTWDIWVGNRGENGAEQNDNDNAPVISYLPAGGQTINNFSADLKNFMNDAVSRDTGLTNQMVLTDIFGGFEIWNGGAGLQLSEFTADVQ